MSSVSDCLRYIRVLRHFETPTGPKDYSAGRNTVDSRFDSRVNTVLEIIVAPDTDRTNI